jgi:NAD(P)-dependent dehydrogenase (short-subunit alcohol dehydrogenase family)
VPSRLSCGVLCVTLFRLAPQYTSNIMPNLTQSDASPKDLGDQPPFEESRQPTPGIEKKMQQQPDHGEESYQGRDRLRDKVALITGGDSGIGKAIAIAYAREGAHVAFGYLPAEEEDARDTVRWIESSGRRALPMAGDVQDEPHCRQLVDRTIQELGGLDILVNNAAFQMTHESIEEVSSEEWERTLRTNLSAMFYLCKAALPRMQQGGAIINTTSVQAYQPTGKLLAYATTKGAIVTFTKGLSELAIERGVRVNAVAPGPVWTPLIPATMPEEKVKHFGQNSRLGRPAQPAELAHSYVFLAALEESSYITGSVMDLTGGKMLP